MAVKINKIVELLLFLTLSITTSATLSEPVRVSNGLVQGTLSLDGTYISYDGIPYATPVRFGPPGPEPTWPGVFVADNPAIACPQHTDQNLYFGDENCLVLFVTTPVNATGLSVIVFVHGGFYSTGTGSSALYSPVTLVKHDVVVVSLNYRLDSLGFLCLGIEESPGNLGLRDQVQAFRWIKRNIEAFGGDPDKITLFGQSAGAASVSFHMLSPMSQGLFNKVILMSGTAIAPWSFQYEPLNIARQYANLLGVNETDPKEIYKHIVNMDPKTLITTVVPRTKGNVYVQEKVFSPCIERNISNVEPFITEAPRDLYKSGKYAKVPVLIGHTDEEGYLFAGAENFTMINQIRFKDALPVDMVFPNNSVKLKIAANLKQLFMGGQEPSEFNRVNLSHYEGDPFFIHPVVDLINILAETNDKPVYAYKFSYSGALNIFKQINGFATQPGATHADDVIYIFAPMVLLLQYLVELKMVEKMNTMWTNFAKYGEPIPTTSPLLPVKWHPFNETNKQVFVIDEEFGEDSLWSNPRVRVIHSLYDKFRRKYVPPWQ